MCTKPDSARKVDAMYSWVREILEGQISTVLRESKPLVIPDDCKRVQPKKSADGVPRDGQVG